MNDSTQAQRSYWDGFAREYERRREAATLLIASTLHHQLRLDSAASVLEVGAGAGAGTVDLANRMPSTARLVATDLSAAMLELASVKCRAYHHLRQGPRIRIIQAQAQHLPFPDGHFDRYVCNLTLMLVADPARTVAEAARVLEPGARAGWSVWGRRSHSPLRTLFAEAAHSANVVLQPPKTRRSLFHLGQPRRFTHLLSQAGFTNIVTWYMPSVEAVTDGQALAEDIMCTELAARTLDASAARSVQRKLADLANERIASGLPIALDILMVTADKPANRSAHALSTTTTKVLHA
ncbi:SAM-dependent methyltransferase [Pandoraea iniqua]|uniref:SAM-dependent methyltransferase n=1 Tax=Pandoraea iniqua TaxID=2508288 RepID=A0A5E4YG36_9BURK|nr:class I SAM-dependent methyltransferase [Pandoraea iniqua]VVE47368.1 SAM-dependent methyltransferase [Pandoraea iniqua]